MAHYSNWDISQKTLVAQLVFLQMSRDMTKLTKSVCTQPRLRSDWASESSMSAWRKLGSLATHWVHSEDSDQTGQMPRLIWVFAGRTLTLLVLSCRSSNAPAQPSTGARSLALGQKLPLFSYVISSFPRELEQLLSAKHVLIVIYLL